MDLQAASNFLLSAGLCAAGIGWVLNWVRIGTIDRTVHEKLWAPHVMKWSDFVALPREFHGSPHYEAGGSGPDRKVVVYIRVCAGLPEPINPEDEVKRQVMMRGDQ